MSLIRIVLTTAAMLWIAPPAAQSAEITRGEIILSAENCQPALPVFDGAIRKRPMAMQNEGDTSAFVTCAFRGEFTSMRSQEYISAGFVNNSASVQDVACTLVDGENAFSTPIYLPKARSLAEGASAGLSWTTADNGGDEYIYPALSCSLPPGVGIQYTARQYDEEIGD